MRRGRFWSSLVSVIFVIYCVEAGLFLVVSPWLESWEPPVRRSALGYSELGSVLVLPWARGAVTGFGLVHLLWSAHDLERLLMGSRPGQARTGSDQTP